MAASLDMFERATRRYGKPDFGITDTRINGERLPVSRRRSSGSSPSAVCCIFAKPTENRCRRDAERVLIVAPMSGHYATLLRGTVEAMLPHADIYITDWADARQVRLSKGAFDLDDYIDYVIEMLHHLGPGTPCHGGVPALGAGAGGGVADECQK